MTFKTVIGLFSFRGRASRRDYALTYLWMFASVLAALFLSVVLGALFGNIVLAAATFALAAVFCVSTLAGLAVSVRRLHDRNRSVWWIVPYWLVPVLLGAAASGKLEGTGAGIGLSFLATMIVGAVIVDLGFLEGTKGPNAHGADPTMPPPLDGNVNTPIIPAASNPL